MPRFDLVSNDKTSAPAGPIARETYNIYRNSCEPVDGTATVDHGKVDE